MSHGAITTAHSVGLWVLAIVFAFQSLGYRVRGEDGWAMVFYFLALAATAVGCLVLP